MISRRVWIGLVAVGAIVLSCGEGGCGCCGCGSGCDCGPLREWQEGNIEETQHELRAVDPVAHAWLRARPEVVAAVGGTVSRIEYRLFLGDPLPIGGRVGADSAKKVSYRVIGSGGQEVEVEVIAVYREGQWTVAGATIVRGAARTVLGEAVEFRAYSGSSSGGGSGGGGGGGFDWD